MNDCIGDSAINGLSLCQAESQKRNISTKNCNPSRILELFSLSGRAALLLVRKTLDQREQHQ